MEIDVPAPIEQVVAFLRQEVEPTQWFRFSREHVSFEGHVDNSGFTISPIIRYRNSFLPVLYGRLTSQPGSTVVRVRMTLHPFAMGFLSVWFGVLTMFAVFALRFFQNSDTTTLLLALVGMGLFGVVLTLICFWIEVPMAKRLLRDALRV